MIGGIILAVIAVLCLIACIGYFVSSQKEVRNRIDKRRSYVESLGPKARVIVNNGTHLFWIDEATQTYGTDCSGKRYDLNAVFALKTHEGGLTIQQRANPQFVDVGKAFGCNIPISTDEIKAIKKELSVYIKKKLDDKLASLGVIPTHEYEYNGVIWGCDLNSEMFYTTYAGAEVHKFSNLISVTIDNGYDAVTNIKLANKRILVYVRVEWDDEPFEYDINADNANKEDEETWNALLSMFKGIRNRA